MNNKNYLEIFFATKHLIFENDLIKYINISKTENDLINEKIKLKWYLYDFNIAIKFIKNVIDLPIIKIQ